MYSAFYNILQWPPLIREILQDLLQCVLYFYWIPSKMIGTTSMLSTFQTHGNMAANAFYIYILNPLFNEQATWAYVLQDKYVTLLIFKCTPLVRSSGLLNACYQMQWVFPPLLEAGSAIKLPMIKLQPIPFDKPLPPSTSKWTIIDFNVKHCRESSNSH